VFTAGKLLTFARLGSATAGEDEDQIVIGDPRLAAAMKVRAPGEN
jgi:hypothetical protein